MQLPGGGRPASDSVRDLFILLPGGAGLFKFFGHPVSGIVGIFLMILSAMTLFVEIRKYRKAKKRIRAIDPEDRQAREAMVYKQRTQNHGRGPL